MALPVDDDLRTMCGQILREGKDAAGWSEIESDDFYQTDTIHGGFDALEQAFTFSYYLPTGEEHWFQLTLGEVAEVARGDRTTVDARVPD